MTKYAIDVRGKRHEWSFMFESRKQDLKTWLEDGLRVDEVVGLIPQWVVDWGLTRIWCFFEDLFNPAGDLKLVPA